MRQCVHGERIACEANARPCPVSMRSPARVVHGQGALRAAQVGDLALVSGAGIAPIR